MCIKMTQWKKYVLWFANELVDFRLPELQSILSMYNISIRWIDQPSDLPFYIVELPSENAAKKIASRSVALRSVHELWSRGKTVGELHNNLRAFPPDQMKPYFLPNLSFRVWVETFCKTLSTAEKLEKIESFSYLPIEGPVKLKDPDVCLYYIEYYGLDPNHIPEKPYDLFFGRWIVDGQRKLITELSLKKRKFIGNTSMDPQLSLLMANQAQIEPGHLVMDPFVGTGSLLVAAAVFGAYVLGTDIDYLMLHGKSRPSRPSQKIREKDEGVRSNLRQYKKEHLYVDVLVADAALPLWKSSLKLDAIITDPPYGIREATERIGSTKSYQISEEHLEGHIPSKIEYGLGELYRDLFQFAAMHLKLGGHLVCWLPVYRSEYNEDKLPHHPSFVLKSNSEQVLTSHSSRRLLTLEKVQEPEIPGECNTQVDMGAVSSAFRKKYFSPPNTSRRERKLFLSNDKHKITNGLEALTIRNEVGDVQNTSYEDG